MTQQFYVALNEQSVGAGGPHGPQQAVDKKVYASLLDRCMDELKTDAAKAVESLNDLVLEKSTSGLVELPFLLTASKNPTFAAQLASAM